MKPMNEKTVIIALPMLLMGGTEIQTLALVRVLREHGHRVIVVCYYESEIGMEEGHGHPGVPAARHLPDPHARMAEEDPEDRLIGAALYRHIA